MNNEMCFSAEQKFNTIYLLHIETELHSKYIIIE